MDEGQEGENVYEEFVEQVLRPKLLDTLKTANQTIQINVFKEMPPMPSVSPVSPMSPAEGDAEPSETFTFTDIYPFHTIYDLCTRIYIEKGQRDEYHPMNQCLLYPTYDELTKRTRYLPFQYSFGSVIENIGLESPFRQIVGNPNKYFVDLEGNATQIPRISRHDILLEDCLYNKPVASGVYTLHLFLYRDILRYFVGEQNPISQIEWQGKFLVYFPEHKRENEDGRVSEDAKLIAPVRVKRFEERKTVIELLDEMLEGGKILKKPGETTRGYDVDLSNIRNLRFAWPNKIRGFELEGLFYDSKVSDIIPYIRLYPKANTPMSKLYVSDDETARPMLEDPSILIPWSEMRSITPEEDVLMTKFLLRSGSGSVHPLYGTLFVMQDGSSKVVIQPNSDEKGLSSQTDLLNLSKTLTSISKSLGDYPVLLPNKVRLDDAYIVLSLWLEQSDTTRITKKRFDKVLPYFKAFFQETSSPIKEQNPILFLRYKCVSNFRTPGREAQFLQRVIDLQKGAGHTSMTFLVKAYKDEFDVTDQMAESRVAEFLRDMTQYEMIDTTNLEFAQKVNPGIDIAIFGKFPYYTFHIYRVDSLETLRRIKTLLALLISVDPIELGEAEESAKVMGEEEEEEKEFAQLREQQPVEPTTVQEELQSQRVVSQEIEGDGREYQLDALGEFPEEDEEETTQSQTMEALVTTDASDSGQGPPLSAPQEVPETVVQDVEEEDDEDEEAGTGTKKRKAVPSPKSYFWLRLKSLDKKLFVYAKKKEGGVKEEIKQYPSACAANALKQPAVMTEIQYKIMRDVYEEDTRDGRVQWVEYPLEEGEEIPPVEKKDASIVTEKITVLRYGSNLAEGQSNVYTCSEFWCMKEGMVILKEDFKGTIGRDKKPKEKDTCPFCRNGPVQKKNRGKMTKGETVIQRTVKDKSVEGKSHTFIQFLKANVHPDGLYLPCCFLTDKNLYDTHPAYASKKAEAQRLVAGIPEETKTPYTELTPMTAAYGERIKKVTTSYISGSEKLPLDFMDGVPKIGVLPPAVDAYFSQRSIPDLVKQDHTVWKLMTDNTTNLPSASGFFRIAVENRKRFQADSFLAAVAPYFECSGANELRTLISTFVTPTMIASLNYGNFLFEFYDPQFRDPTQKELLAFTTTMGMETSFGVRKEYIRRIWKSYMNFRKSLEDIDTLKESRQFYNLFTVPDLFKWTSSAGVTYKNGVLFIILEVNKEGNVEIKYPPYGVTPMMANRCDIAFLLHYKAQRIWEPIFYTKNVANRDPKKAISTTTMIFAQDISGSWPSIVVDRYNEYLEMCKTNGLGVYTESPYVKSSSLIPLSKAMEIPSSESLQKYAILRDIYNHVSCVLFRVAGEYIFLPVVDDGTIYMNQRVEFDWKNFIKDAAPVESVRAFYDDLSTRYNIYEDLLPEVKGSYEITNMFRLNKSAKDHADIYGLKLKGGIFVPVKKGSTDNIQTGEEGTQLTWYMDNEIVFGKRTSMTAEFDQKEFEEVFQHLRYTFANWLSTMGNKDSLIKDINEILYDARGNVNMLITLDEKRQRLFILFGHTILGWLDSSLEQVNRNPTLKRIDCTVMPKDSCTNRCVWKDDDSKCLLHVNNEVTIGRQRVNGKYILVKRLIEELLRFPKKRSELLERGVRQYIKLRAPFRNGTEYIVPEYLPEWKELLRMEWRYAKEEKPKYIEEFSWHEKTEKTTVSLLPEELEYYLGNVSDSVKFFPQESIWDALVPFGLTVEGLEKIGQSSDSLMFSSVKVAQLAAKIMNLSIYQFSYEEGVPQEPIIVKGKISVKNIQPFLVLVQLSDSTVGILSSDKEQVQPIPIENLSDGMKSRIKSVTPTYGVLSI